MMAAQPFVVAVAVIVGLLVRRRQMLLSIGAGTAVRVALATLLV